MIFLSRITYVVALFGLAVNCAVASAPEPASPPNLIIIMADDLGYTDLGAFGGEIRTPHLDELAWNGLRMSNFHAGPSCAPTRAMLLTGTDNHLAGMGSQGALATPNQKGSPAYQNSLATNVPTIAEHLRALGYATLASAKWHLGGDVEKRPNARGFDRSFVLLQGGSGHFDATPLFESHVKASWLEDDSPVELPAGFYSSDDMTDKMLQYMSGVPAQQPIFAYLSYTAPHWPLQAPQADIKRYTGKYDLGWDVLNEQRMAGVKREKLIPTKSKGVVYEPGMVPWVSLTPNERAEASRRMEVYAAMVDRLDQNVGRLLAALKASDRWHNSVILFLSDNGAEAHRMELYSTNDRWVPKTFDNHIENIGTKTSYTTLGPGWARATAAPFRDSKSKLAEGGVRVPAFVRLPNSSQGGIEHSFMRVMDIAPTFLQLAGGDIPDEMMGRSLVDVWQGGASPYKAGESIAAETYGRRMVRRDNWKALFQPPPYGTGAWQLYDLAEDLGEQNDLALEEPQLLQSLIKSYQNYASSVGVIDPELPIGY